MRALALLSGGFFLVAATQQVSIPAPLVRDYAALAAAPSLTVVYKVAVVGESPGAYKLVLSRIAGEGAAFRLTSPDGFVVGDGKTVTSYRAKTKTYVEEPYTEAWAAAFARRPEVMAWGAFLLKEPAADVAAAKAGAARTILGNPTTEVEVTLKKSSVPATLYLDRKLGVARGALVKVDGKETLVTATTVEIGKEPVAATEFAFVAPEGAKKEEAVAASSFTAVNALIQERCQPCHSGGNPKAGINLASYEGIKATVVPGDPKGSLLVKSVHGDGVRKMPLGGKPMLNAAELALLENWVKDGAKQ